MLRRIQRRRRACTAHVLARSEMAGRVASARTAVLARDAPQACAARVYRGRPLRRGSGRGGGIMSDGSRIVKATLRDVDRRMIWSGDLDIEDDVSKLREILYVHRNRVASR